MIQEVGKGNTYELVAKSNGTSASIILRSVKNRRTRLSIDVALDDKITISILKANGKFGTGGKICKYLLTDLSDGIGMEYIQLLPQLED